MIRTKKINTPQLQTWLKTQPLPTPGAPQYYLRLLRTDAAAFDQIEGSLKEYIQEAHEDARRKLRDSLADDLSPFTSSTPDPAENYPAILHKITLKGYWGEVLAGLLVEHLGAHGKSGWCIPAYLFRHHVVELQHLENINQKLRQGENYDPDAPENKRPGRTGDDVLAFIMGDDGQISDVLVLEAKCVDPHNATILGNAHTQISETRTPPVDILRLLEILKDYDTTKAKAWRLSLTNYYASGHKNADRYNGVSYVCTNPPKQATSWMPHEKPHEKYTTPRKLKGLEIHMPELDEVIERIYRSANNG
ncbi:MAG TPA: hypothetical protein VFT64_01720 [Rickettsiales bacterium]|nr:hypothetical protein [Rickettsiales bacterium]